MGVLEQFDQEPAVILMLDLLRQVVHAPVAGDAFRNLGEENANLRRRELRDVLKCACIG